MIWTGCILLQPFEAQFLFHPLLSASCTGWPKSTWQAVCRLWKTIDCTILTWLWPNLKQSNPVFSKCVLMCRVDFTCWKQLLRAACLALQEMGGLCWPQHQPRARTDSVDPYSRAWMKQGITLPLNWRLMWFFFLGQKTLLVFCKDKVPTETGLYLHYYCRAICEIGFLCLSKEPWPLTELSFKLHAKPRGAYGSKLMGI